MFAIYRNWAGYPFLGVVAETEQDAWNYLDKTYGYNGWGCNRDGFIVKEIPIVK